jgi:hypothetical protein
MLGRTRCAVRRFNAFLRLPPKLLGSHRIEAPAPLRVWAFTKQSTLELQK